MKPGKTRIILRSELTYTQFWLSEPFSSGQAWVDLMLMAVPANAEDLFPGAVCCSVRSLSRRWQWTRYRTEKFLRDLEDMGWIELNQSSPGEWTGRQPSIYLVNYEASESAPAGFQQKNHQPSRPSDDHSDIFQQDFQTDFQPGSRLENKASSPSAPVKNQSGSQPGSSPENNEFSQPASAENQPDFCRNPSHTEDLPPEDFPLFGPPKGGQEREKEDEIRLPFQETSTQEHQVPPEYADRFATWKEFISWRYQ